MNISKGVTAAAKTVVKVAMIITTVLTIGENMQQLKELIKNDD